MLPVEIPPSLLIACSFVSAVLIAFGSSKSSVFASQVQV